MAEDIKKNGVGARAERRDEYSTSPIEVSRWTAFKSAWTGGMSRVMMVSFFSVLFALPAIIWIIMFSTFFMKNVGTSFNYGIFDGIGYAGPDALLHGMGTANYLGAVRYFEYNLVQFSVMIPLIAIASIGIGGLVSFARRTMFGDNGKAVVGKFFSGLKGTWLPSLIGGTLVGSGIFLVIVCAYSFDASLTPSIAAKIVTLIFSILLLVILSIYAFYLVTLSANYKMPLTAILKDALVLTFKRFVSNAITALIASLIVGAAFLFLFMFGDSFGMIVWFLLFFIGFYAISTVFVVFNQKTFDKAIAEDLLYRESKAKTEQSYAAIRAAKQSGERPVKKTATAPTKYVNPKKKKKGEEPVKKESIKPIAPAPKKSGYTAEELAKMEEDKQRFLQAQTQIDEDLSAYTDDEE